LELYLNIDKVPGEVTEAEHDKWIKLHSYTFGVQSENVEDPSARGKLVSSSGTYSPISVSKDADITSPLLQQIASEGSHIATVKLHACLDTQQKTPALEIELTDVVISEFSVSGSEGMSTQESVGFRFGKIKVTNRNFDEKGAKKTEPSFTWNLLTKKSG
jgi:type VI secretion system secreted protein Hcp